MSSSFISVIPPFLVIGLVILTRKVVLSLGAGITCGAILLEDWQFGEALHSIWKSFLGIFHTQEGWNTGNLQILSFLLLLGVLTGFITAMGGNRAFGQIIGRRIHTKKGAQTMTAVSGVALFPDDVFNMFATSQITSPVLDHVKVPRTKLAYLLHSTSDPTCVLCPLSSWGAYIIAILASIFASMELQTSPVLAFMIIATTNFYALTTLVLAFSSAIFDINIGKMATLKPARKWTGSAVSAKGNVWHMIIPISLLVGGSGLVILITGWRGSESKNIIDIFANSNVSYSLMLGAFLACAVSSILFCRFTSSFNHYLKSLKSVFAQGIRTTMPAVLILLFAWMLSSFIEELGTGQYLASLIKQWNMSPSFLPVTLFLLTGVMAFSTGTSWGTFAVMLPISAQIAAAADPDMLYILMSAVLSGSLFGDHCSPVSDTTTVASAAAGCTQMEHVVTQLPYALICAAISTVSFLIIGLTGHRIPAYLLAIILLACCVLFFARFPHIFNSKSEQADG